MCGGVQWGLDGHLRIDRWVSCLVGKNGDGWFFNGIRASIISHFGGGDPKHVFSNGEYCCHHKNGIKWDNRGENIALVEAGEHSKIHWTDDFLRNDRIAEELCRELRRQYKEGGTLRSIADNYGYSKSGIANHVKGDCDHVEGDLTPGYKGPREGPWRDQEAFQHEYVENGKSMKQLSREWGCTDRTVRVWREKHGFD